MDCPPAPSPKFVQLVQRTIAPHLNPAVDPGRTLFEITTALWLGLWQPNMPQPEQVQGSPGAFWQLAACHCPGCGSQDTWCEVGEGEYYMGPNYLCATCGHGGNHWHAHGYVDDKALTAIRARKVSAR